MSTNQDEDQFIAPNVTFEEPIDMSLSDVERNRRNAFYRKIERMKQANQLVMECSKCLLLFSDLILYRIHMTMHGSTLHNQSWQCAMCKRQCTDRRHFLSHTIKFGHDLIPDGVVLPSDLSYTNGLPDLTSALNDIVPNDDVVPSTTSS